MRKVFKISLAVLTPVFIFTVGRSTPVKAASVQCANDEYCEMVHSDGINTAEELCKAKDPDAVYTPPDYCEGMEDPITGVPSTGNCCVPYTSIDDVPIQCDSDPAYTGYICTSAGQSNCFDYGGFPAYCEDIFGDPGSCCQPSRAQCDPDYECRSVVPSACTGNYGYQADCIDQDTNVAGNCCVDTSNDGTSDDDVDNPFTEILDMFYVREEELAAEAYNFIMPIGVAIGIFSIIIAGYGFMTSQGNPDKVKAAQEKLTAAITGTIFIVLSIIILKVIINTLF